MKLYKATLTLSADDYDMDDYIREDAMPTPDPAGWAEYCEERWGEYRPFFTPTDRKLYRSRSAAQARVDLINRWLGPDSAVLEEADAVFEPVAQANLRRSIARRQARIDKLRAEIARLEAA